jgi:hypothetical protein
MLELKAQRLNAKVSKFLWKRHIKNPHAVMFNAIRRALSLTNVPVSIVVLGHALQCWINSISVAQTLIRRPIKA